MLRPACLLPVAWLLPPHGLLTPRLGVRGLPLHLGPGAPTLARTGLAPAVQ